MRQPDALRWARCSIKSPPMLVRSPLARDRRRPEGFIPPALLTPATKVPTGPKWIHELKHDGIRLIARKDSDRVRLCSRYGRKRTSDSHSRFENRGDDGLPVTTGIAL